MQFFTPAREHFFRPLTHDNDPGQDGCGHADQYLLPLLRQHGRFLDQEALKPDAASHEIPADKIEI